MERAVRQHITRKLKQIDMLISDVTFHRAVGFAVALCQKPDVVQAFATVYRGPDTPLRR